jgi:hypothetical protein
VQTVGERPDLDPSDRDLRRRLRVTIALVVVSAGAGLLGAVLNSIACELAFVVLAVLAVLAGWISLIRQEARGRNSRRQAE